MAEAIMPTALGDVRLVRGHTPATSPLRAWSAADVLLVDDLASTDPGRLLIVNDAWGALSVPTAAWEPVVWSDSALARWSIDRNLRANGASPLADRAIPGDRRPEGRFDTIAIAVPKSATLLRYQVEAVRQVVTPASRIVVAGMSRYLPRSVFEALRALGEPQARRAVGKARLVDIAIDVAMAEAVTRDHLDSGPGGSLRPVTSEAFRTDDGVVVHQAPGVFSAGHLDVGTALLLEGARRLEPPAAAAGKAPQCLDLGCGNGVLGTSLALAWPATTWRFRDVSDLAAASANATWRANGLARSRADIAVCDVAADVATGSVDLVVTNPPFHHEHAADPDLTARVLADAARVLRRDGVALVVAQRHLRTDVTMGRFFAEVAVVSAHPSHVVMVARRPRRPR